MKISRVFGATMLVLFLLSQSLMAGSVHSVAISDAGQLSMDSGHHGHHSAVDTSSDSGECGDMASGFCDSCICLAPVGPAASLSFHVNLLGAPVMEYHSFLPDPLSEILPEPPLAS
ncbi:hypothetical protein Selin_0032 [Desulfurispirillum indicum S5]|uniref:DUF2946 domain-containing protein n=1 Tax=Desulfurispirillum indicum (strain ATCC BAA-1389 / DSM 22839 / S5) TaxID=653733 RepID=E6W4R3_DESIS|nr:hypothetical protein [Desulfurispirillum indicum]ADU64791.1 hypothetical protein Selin_0032 [Desulfurispirillum indicum S5]